MARRRSNDEISWEVAIKEILRERGGAMQYTEIAEEISSRGLKSVANPAASVAMTLTKSFREADSPFVRLGRGEYALREALVTKPIAEILELDDEPETGALRAFGMFWQRDYVIWSEQPKLLGRQSEGASGVDFRDQVGVYLLHDRERVIYVGRAADTLFARLKAHTSDRLGGRWDRFSWFGLKPVGEDGRLGDAAVAWTHEIVIETLEALLIESLEPPLNRKRGDNFGGAEYLQVLDPDIEKRRMKVAFDDIWSKQGS